MTHNEILKMLREQSLEKIDKLTSEQINGFQIIAKDSQTTFLHLIAEELKKFATANTLLSDEKYQKEIFLFRKFVASQGPVGLFLPVSLNKSGAPITTFSILAKIPENGNNVYPSIFGMANAKNKHPIDQMYQMYGMPTWVEQLNELLTIPAHQVQSVIRDIITQYQSKFSTADPYEDYLNFKICTIETEELSIKDMLIATGRLDIVRQFYLLHHHWQVNGEDKRQVSTPKDLIVNIIDGKDTSYLSEHVLTSWGLTKTQKTLVQLEQQDIIQKLLFSYSFNDDNLIFSLRSLIDPKNSNSHLSKIICYVSPDNEVEGPIPYIQAVLDALDQKKDLTIQRDAWNALAKYAGVSKKLDYYNAHYPLMK